MRFSQLTRMRISSTLKKEFLKKWLLGLQAGSSTKQNMTILERKTVIKQSADIAMASTRNGATCWSRALLIANSSQNSIANSSQNSIANSSQNSIANHKPYLHKGDDKRMSMLARSKKILKKSCSIKRVKRVHNMSQRGVVEKSIAKKLVKKKTKVLKSLVPGGELMDDICLIEETLDYIVSLQAQVDVMRTLANKATDIMINSKSKLH